MNGEAPRFSPGDEVCLKCEPSTRGMVKQCRGVVGDTYQYLVRLFSGKACTYFEEQLEGVEEDEAEAIGLDDFMTFYAAKKFSTNSSTSIFSLNSGKIKFIPFQFRPLTKILNADRPRLLIADEVGVGKTIETGLIIKEFEKRRDIRNILIVCPKELTYKWQKEMREKFNEDFVLMDSSRLAACFQTADIYGEWPPTEAKCIVSLELIRRNEIKEELEKLSLEFRLFDMLVLDEAHHVCNQGKSRDVIEVLCRNIEIALFLSATPLQLAQGDLYSLLNLLSPETFMDQKVFKDMVQPNAKINEAVRAVRRPYDPNWKSQAVSALSGIGCNEWAKKAFSNNELLSYWLDQLKQQGEMTDAQRIECLRDLESLHTLSHIINRTKRKDIGAFTIREPQTVLTKYTESERCFYESTKEFKRAIFEAGHDNKIVNLIMSTIERQITSSLPAFVRFLDDYIDRGLATLQNLSDDIDWETSVDFTASSILAQAKRLRALASTLPRKDSKAESLLQIVRTLPQKYSNGKVLVFSFFKKTLAYLEEVLSEAGIRVGVITGDVPADERQDLRDRFRSEDADSIDVLLCSEVGCEGLDYEFCSCMVNYDIPWNPMKIEQRIGRIDRFGQKSPKVLIFNFITENTVEELVFFRCFDRLNVFSNTIGDLEGILGETSFVRKLTADAINLDLSEQQKVAKATQETDNLIRMVEAQRQFDANSKDLFLLDVEQKDASLAGAKAAMQKLTMHLTASFLSRMCPRSSCAPVGEAQIRVNLTAEDKQRLYAQLKEAEASLAFDFNNLEMVQFQRHLEGSRTLVLNFETEEQKQTNHVYVTPTHPLLYLAAKANLPTSSEHSVTFRTQSDSVAPGRYLFGCYEWKEFGYRKLDDLRVLMINEDSGENKLLTDAEFESLLQHAEDCDGCLPTEGDSVRLETAMLSIRRKSKARLEAVNQGEIMRKIASIERFAANEQRVAQEQIAAARSARIKKMREAQIIRSQIKAKQRCQELRDLLNSDISTNRFLTGTIEVI